MSKMIDKQKLLEQIDYYETQYSGSASHFDHGARYISSRIRDDIASGQFDIDSTEIAQSEEEVSP